MAAMMEIMMACLMEHRTARLTEFHLECSTGRHWDQMLDLPMASATEASMAHGLELPMDRHSVFLMGSPMAATTAILMVHSIVHNRSLRTALAVQIEMDALAGVLGHVLVGVG